MRDLLDFPDPFSSQAAQDFQTLMIIALVVGLIGLGISIFLCVWVYRDATAKQIDSPGLWVVLMLFLGIVGLIIYLIVRNGKLRERQMMGGMYQQYPGQPFYHPGQHPGQAPPHGYPPQGYQPSPHEYQPQQDYQQQNYPPQGYPPTQPPPQQ
jgi:hypothetical protein